MSNSGTKAAPAITSNRTRTGDIEVPVVHERTRPREQSQNEDPTKRYSLPIQIDLDRLHDPNYRTSQPGRGSLDVVFSECFFCVFV